MRALLALVPGWVWLALAVAAALGVQQLRIAAKDRTISDQAEQVTSLTGELTTANVRVGSLKNTLSLMRQVNTDNTAIADGVRQEFKDAKAERDSLAECLRTRSCVVRVAAKWVPSAGRPAGPAATQPGADGGACELDPAAEQDLLDLREGVKRQRAVILGWQEYREKVLSKCKLAP